MPDPARPNAEDLLRQSRVAMQRGDHARALTCCHRAQEADPTWHAPYVLLGVLLRRSDPARARAALEHALSLAPQDADAAFHLGNLLREQGRSMDAIAAYERALAAAAGHPSVVNNLAMACAEAGDAPRAEALYRTILDRDPAHANALRNLARLLSHAGRHVDAIELFQRFLGHHRAEDPDFWVDFATSQLALGDAPAAERTLRHALALAPDDATLRLNLASVLVAERRFADALGLLRDIAAGDDAHPYAVALRAHVAAHVCEWRELPALHARLRRLLAISDAPVDPFFTLALPLGLEEQHAAARRWAQDLGRDVQRIALPARASHAPLRVGYVSADFRTHALAFLATEVWERHDRTRVHTTAYALAPREHSELGSRIAAAFDRFVLCDADDDAAIARRIAQDQIDVLIDLGGYTTHSRPRIFAFRPAPVQLHWLGYLGTLGAPWIDGVITDRFACPPEWQAHFTERLVYLPDCYCPSDTRRAVASDPGTRASHGLPADAVVLCCFNPTYKLLPSLFARWMRVLAMVPDAVLWMTPGNDTAAGHLRRHAAEAGVDPDRLVFAPHVPAPQHLARHAHADLYLDTTPYNAGTAANDALLMGVPVVTCSGGTMASRVAGSQLMTLGLPDLVTTDLDAYADRIVSLASDRGALAALKARLRRQRETAPLFDMIRFTRMLEETLLRVARGVRDDAGSHPPRGSM